ncbi:bacteriorhodopsin-like [Spirosoma montaniterrae]|uniref:Rhodopsin n=1 Tax=Spirosoma montaniterrae TaxID=1178516 RepID=A0A1P9WSA9_9BACT|nr:bacteriorhodopsin-like [Spirosoma montaniterrae]AQG78264.1 rhodopsin [Spirosoma montaniterrae]
METILLVGDLRPGDVVGFTFFTGYMAMFAASVFFFLERSQVEGHWKTSLTISGLITMIAAVHYFYMRDQYLATNSSPTEFRYIDWTLTVPLMCVEFYLIIKPFGGKISTMWKLIGYSVFMLVFGYVGESLDRPNSAIWGAVSTVGYIGILYEIYLGDVKKIADASRDASTLKAVSLLRWFVLVGWAIYPIGYMMIPGGLLAGLNINIDLIYNIGDAINKIGFGLVVYSAAVANSKAHNEAPVQRVDGRFNREPVDA